MAIGKLPLAIVFFASAVTSCAPPALAKPPAHLVPFPEDAPRAPAAKASKLQQPPVNFQPRFRTPAVKQAEHIEPAGDAKATDDQPHEVGSAPQALPVHADTTSAPAALKGREALDAAYAKSKNAASEAECTEVIDLCRQSDAATLGKQFEEYANRLMSWAYNRRGEARAREGKKAEALADFEASVAAGGTWRAIHNRGASYAAAGRDQEARIDLDRAIELNPRYPQAYLNRAELRSKQRDFQGAIDDFNLAMKLGARDAAVFAGRAHAYYRLQRFGDALRDYGEAIKNEPENADTLVSRGDVYSDVGQYGDAAKDYRSAVRVGPKNARAYQAAAWLMATCPDTHYRDEKLAVEAAQRAVELEGDTYRNLSTLAAAQASAGLFKDAQKTQEQAIAAARKEDVVTAEKVLSLYRREIAYRDRPVTAFRTPEEIDDKEVRQAAANEPADQAPATGQRAWFQAPGDPRAGVPPKRQGPPQYREALPRPKQGKARLFGPRGRI
jgi:tetratricopeptide (TPR) repeat protein